MIRSAIGAVASALVLFGLSACQGSAAAATSDEQRACERVVRFCNGGERDRRECERAFVDMRATGGGDANSQRTIRCINEATTCGGGTGCLAGGASRSGAEFFRDFMNSFTR